MRQVCWHVALGTVLTAFTEQTAKPRRHNRWMRRVEVRLAGQIGGHRPRGLLADWTCKPAN